MTKKTFNEWALENYARTFFVIGLVYGWCGFAFSVMAYIGWEWMKG